MKRPLGAALAAIALIAAPVRAQCWDQEEASAASVRQLQSMLMVATLRCHAAGYDIAGDYNAFLGANKTALMRSNERLKAHFIRASGPVAGQRAYDGFTTSMANGYGAGGTSAETCGSMAALQREAVLMANSIEGLVLIAEREAAIATMPGGRCDAQMTLASTATARVIVAAAQPIQTPVIAARPEAAPAMIAAASAVVELPAGADAGGLGFIPGH